MFDITSKEIQDIEIQATARKAKLQINYQENTGVLLIPESLNVSILIVDGSAQINSVDGQVLSSPVPMPLGFSLELPFKSHYYYYPTIEIELLEVNSKAYFTYEELYLEFYPSN